MTAFHWEHRNPSSPHDTSIPVQSLSFFLFPQFFAVLSFKKPRLGFWGVEKWWKAFLFWIRVGRCNYSGLWNLHRESENRAAECSHYLQTDIRETLFDLASFLCDFWQLYQIKARLWTNLGSDRYKKRQNKILVFLFRLVHTIVQY